MFGPPKLRAIALQREKSETVLLDIFLAQEVLTNLSSSRHAWKEADGLQRS